jgi:hypothetical protein
VEDTSFRLTLGCPKSIAKQVKDRVRSEPLSNRTKATGALLLSGGAWTPHDLRRTGATMMGDVSVIGRVSFERQRSKLAPCFLSQSFLSR